MVEAWNGWRCWVCIAPRDDASTDVEYRGAIEFGTLEITQGAKDFDIVNLLSGGCIEKPTPEGEYTITFDGYFIDLDTSDNSGILQEFHTKLASWDTTESTTGLTVTNSLNRENYRVVVLFTDDANVSIADGTVPIGSVGLRFILSNARFVEATPISFSDNLLKLTCKFKAPPYTKLGAGNFTIQSSTGLVSSALATLGAYTSTLAPL